MSKDRLKIFHDFLAILIILICGGCFGETESPPIPTIATNMIDESWLTGKPCSLPCWFGLIPGASSKEDVLNKIKNIQFLSSNPPFESQRRNWDFQKMIYYDEDMLTFECINPPGGTCIVMDFRDDLLRSFRLYQTYSLTFDEVVMRMGEPDGYTTVKLTPEAQGCNVTLYWKEQKLAITHTEAWFNWYSDLFRKELCEKVKSAGNKIPRGLSVESVEIMDDYTWGFLTKEIHPWNGFVGDK